MKIVTMILAWAWVVVAFIPLLIIYVLCDILKNIGKKVMNTFDPVPTHLRNWVDKYKKQ